VLCKPPTNFRILVVLTFVGWW